MPDPGKYHETDKAMTRHIRQEMARQGTTSYPAMCPDCQGEGQNRAHSVCPNCKGAGSYELAVS